MKFKVFVSLIIIIFLGLIFLPIIYWFQMDSLKVDIAIIDKSVQDNEYREHVGFFWLLNYYKITDNNGKLYDKGVDYYGYHPKSQEMDNDIGEYYKNVNPDLFYLIDTYGIYKEPYVKKIIGDDDNKIYGGLSSEEWNDILNLKDEEDQLIVEFNTLALPTKPSDRNIIEEYYSMEWKGWFVRYYPNLKNVPKWIKEDYEYHNRDKWSFKGEGIVFVNQFDKVIVLEESDFDGNIMFTLTESGENHYQKAKDSKFNKWFEVVVPQKGTEIEAEFIINFTKEGENKLKENNIPTRYPAIIYIPDKKSYYFTGDFSDSKIDYWSKWQLPKRAQSLIAYFKGIEEFYWKSYEPIMMEVIVDSVN